MAKKHKCPEEASERWAIPYADFLTLLLALFIALYAIMRGAKAIPIYAEAFAKAMGMRILPFEQTLPTQILPEPVLPRVQLTQKGTYINMQLKRIEQMLKEQGLEGKFKVKLVPQGIKLILQDTILFKSGSADIDPKYYPLLDSIYKIISSLPNPIEIDGYTDNTPIHTPIFPSNWELSTDRAASVAKYFISKGFDPSKIKIAGYGKYHPLVPNTTPENKAMNRRVEITILNIKGSELTTLAQYENPNNKWEQIERNWGIIPNAQNYNNQSQ
jgi:chemotaxis protein MotB